MRRILGFGAFAAILAGALVGYYFRSDLRKLAVSHRGHALIESVEGADLPWKEVGVTHDGHRIRMLSCGEGPGVIVVLGAVHGDEPSSAALVLKLSQYVYTDLKCELRNRVLILPVVNPDGLARGSRRNASGVDLNRNFPTRNWTPQRRSERYDPGPSPGSELETRLLVDLISKHEPILIVSVHSPLHMVNYDGPAEALANRMGELNGYPVSADIGYETPGSLGTYAGVERRIPTITLELRHGPAEDLWAENREALLAALRYSDEAVESPADA